MNQDTKVYETEDDLFADLDAYSKRLSSKIRRARYVIIGFIPDKIRRVKWFIQRGRRGYADCDLWSLDSYLARMLPQALRQLRDTSHGYPQDLTFEEWDMILTQMAEGFEEHTYIMDYKNWPKENDVQTYLEWVKPHQDKLEAGIALFGKYYQSLWD